MKLESKTQSRYSPDPGTVEGPVKCGVCGEIMDVSRNVDGPTNFVMAMGGSKRLHDAFSCPCNGEDWHNQAIAIREEAKQTASATLQGMLEREADRIVLVRKATKPEFTAVANACKSRTDNLQ